MVSQVIYFSLNKRTESVFCEFVEQQRFCFKDSFRLLRSNAHHVSDLFEVLDAQKDVSRLHVIIDYLSFYGVTEVASPDSRNGKYDLAITAAKQLRRAIMMYPEVNFLFDESGLPHHVNYTAFLFPDTSLREDVDKIYIQYHQFNNANPEPFIALLNGENNLYDGTNLRNAIKRYLYNDLKCSRRNFSLVQDSRRDHLAICVEEEISQNRFNSYAAYSNGFRVLPIITSNELQEINKATQDGIINPDIVVRDYDLQFSDVIQNNGRACLYEVTDSIILSVLSNRTSAIVTIDSQQFELIDNVWYEVNKKIKRQIREDNESNIIKEIIQKLGDANSMSITRYEDNNVLSQKLVKNNGQWSCKDSGSVVQESDIRGYLNNQNCNPIFVIIFGDKTQRGFEYSRVNGKWYEYISINEIDRIRGAKHNDERGIWYALCETELNPYWDALSYNNDERLVYFVSKGGPRIITTSSKFKKERMLAYDESHVPFNSCNKDVFADGVKKQIVRGLEKPVSGLYLPFHSFKVFKDRYDGFGESELFIKNHAIELAEKCSSKGRQSLKDKIILCKYLSEDGFFKNHPISAIRVISSVLRCKLDNHSEGPNIAEVIEADRHRKEQGWVIRTDRENHNHGVPLDLYDLAKSMINRAAGYYKNARFIKAAIISSEAIEVLNGFHEALMLEAYHVLATSENAIAMNTLGGSEVELANDARFRIHKIEHDVDRMMAREGKDRRDLKYNILNQIFFDCRALCQAKEHFLAEDCFISALAHVNEGFTLNDIGHEVCNILRSIRNNWETYKSEYGKEEE